MDVSIIIINNNQPPPFLLLPILFHFLLLYAFCVYYYYSLSASNSFIDQFIHPFIFFSSIPMLIRCIERGAKNTEKRKKKNCITFIQRRKNGERLSTRQDERKKREANVMLWQTKRNHRENETNKKKFVKKQNDTNINSNEFCVCAKKKLNYVTSTILFRQFLSFKFFLITNI